MQGRKRGQLRKMGVAGRSTDAVWVKIASMRTRLMATAVRTCCAWVRTNPSQREQRSPMARAPCEKVLSIPARKAEIWQTEG